MAFVVSLWFTLLVSKILQFLNPLQVDTTDRLLVLSNGVNLRRFLIIRLSCYLLGLIFGRMPDQILQLKVLVRLINFDLNYRCWLLFKRILHFNTLLLRQLRIQTQLSQIMIVAALRYILWSSSHRAFISGFNISLAPKVKLAIENSSCWCIWECCRLKIECCLICNF